VSILEIPLVSEIIQSKALVRCPPPSQIFQGRQDILERMDECFSNDTGGRHVYVLYGLGGSGKTQIALKFLDLANKPNPRYSLLCNVRCITADDLT
jgi:Cdc6-like AAA superfamily ATPase